jgi:O-antigen/teichoic acid export membrane protein
MIKRNLVANYFGTGWTVLMGLIFLPLYIKYLGIEAYGLIGVFMLLQGLFALLDMGLSPTLNREMARFTAGMHTPQSIHNLLRSMEILFLGSAVLVMVLIFGLSSWVATDWLNAQTLGIKTVTQALAITGVIIGLRWISTLYRSALMGLEHQVWLNFANASFSTIRGVGAVAVLAYLAPTIQAFFAYQAIIGAIEVAVYGWKTRKVLPVPPHPPQFSMYALKGIGNFAAGMTTITVLGTVMMQVDKLLLSRLLSLEQFGYYTLATTVAGAITALSIPISNVAYPRFTSLVTVGDERAVADLYHKFAQLLTIAIIPAALVLFFFSKEIIFLWTRDTVTSQAVAPILSVLVIGSAFNGLSHAPYAVQLAHGRQRLTIIASSISVATLVSALLILVPRYGVMSAAWVWVVISVGYVIFAIPAMHTQILKQEKWKWYSADVFLPMIVGLLFTAAMYALFEANEGMTKLGEMAFLSVGGGVVLAATATATQVGRETMTRAMKSFRKNA